MLGLSFLQALFMCFGTILLLVGEVTTPHVLMCIGCYVVAVLLQIAIELKDQRKANHTCHEITSHTFQNCYHQKDHK